MTTRQFLLIAALSLLPWGSGQTQSSGGTFVLNPDTLDGGGSSSGGTLTLTATIGQSDASNAMTDRAFQLTGGFWRGGGGSSIFQDGFE